MKYLTVNFSGSTAEYNYNFPRGEPSVGDRVVVPTKMKGDGTVTLTIATVVALSDTPLPNAEKPVIGFLCGTVIAVATVICARLEAERVQALS